MNDAEQTFLSLRHPPLRIDAEQVGWRLGMTRDEVRICSSPRIIRAVRSLIPTKDQPRVLSTRDLLRPSGNPTQQCRKYCLESYVERLARDAAWVDRAMRAVRLYWRAKHQKPSGNPPDYAPNAD